METHEQPGSGKIGMWLFLLSEILLFGGLFLLYAVYRYRFAAEFHEASLELSRVAGTLNTAVLLTSSLTVALAVHAMASRADARRAVLYLGATVLLGSVFLGVKGFEWAAKFRHGAYPGAPELLARPPGEVLYVGLYFTMTGLHALHVVVGLGVLLLVLGRVRGGGITAGRHQLLENGGLYWHLVDIVWIFLFPLFYLIG